MEDEMGRYPQINKFAGMLRYVHVLYQPFGDTPIYGNPDVQHTHKKKWYWYSRYHVFVKVP